MRRLTRLTNGFSRKRDNLTYASALSFAYYNFCRIHESIRCTPAIKAGQTKTVWTLKELTGIDYRQIAEEIKSMSRNSSGYSKEMSKLDTIYNKLQKLNHKINILKRTKPEDNSDPNPGFALAAVEAMKLKNTKRKGHIDSEALDIFTQLIETQLDMQLVVWECILEVYRIEERLYDPTSRNGLWIDIR